MNTEENQTEMVLGTGSNPVPRTIPPLGILDPAELPLRAATPPDPAREINRPLLAPLPEARRRLSRSELRYLADVMKIKSGLCASLAETDEAEAMRTKLLAIHAEGWE